MKAVAVIALLLSVTAGAQLRADDRRPNTSRDILVTLNDDGAAAVSGGVGAPYQKRKHYALGPQTRRRAADIAGDYALVEIDRWPIRSLSVFCFVYRVPKPEEREQVVERLRADPRVESVQSLNGFETLTSDAAAYDDQYSGLQRGLTVMNVPAAHRYSRGRGVRIAIVDSSVDIHHEDLEGRIHSLRVMLAGDEPPDAGHGTAVASVIGAAANNAKGIVGVAPDAELDIFVACWASDVTTHAVCDSFTLAKALDGVINSSPDVLNLSLVGPYDPLLARLLKAIDAAGVVTIAARPAAARDGQDFPASLAGVIGVSNGDERPPLVPASMRQLPASRVVYAPGEQIMVALPHDSYDFRSGDSLAAANVSGVVALLLSASPGLSFDRVQKYLRESQNLATGETQSIDACVILRLAGTVRECPGLQ